MPRSLSVYLPGPSSNVSAITGFDGSIARGLSAAVSDLAAVSWLPDEAPGAAPGDSDAAGAGAEAAGGGAEAAGGGADTPDSGAADGLPLRCGLGVRLNAGDGPGDDGCAEPTGSGVGGASDGNGIGDGERRAARDGEGDGEAAGALRTARGERSGRADAEALITPITPASPVTPDAATATLMLDRCTIEPTPSEAEYAERNNAAAHIISNMRLPARFFFDPVFFIFLHSIPALPKFYL